MSEKKVDQEWKKRAREEKEQFSKETQEPPEPAEASFSLIVSSFVAQALIALGEIESPLNGQRRPDLAAAKFSIDLLQVLADKTKGNLSEDEARMLEDALYDLRMRYVEASP